MQVGIVTPRYPPNIVGGGEISVALLAEQLECHPDIDRVVVFSFDGTQNETRNGVEVRRLAKISSFLTEWQNLRAIPYVRNNIDEFDVIHSYNMELHPVVGSLTENRTVSSVATLNSYHFLPKSASNVTPGLHNRLYEVIGYPTTGRILRHYVKKIDSFVALSTSVKDIYTAYGFNAGSIEVIPNMINPSFSVPEVKFTEKFTVLYVGSLKNIKGVEYLIRAFTHLSEEYQLKIVGDGPQRDKLEELVETLGLTDVITFVGYVEPNNVSEQYAQADLFVHPGVWPEPFGRTLLEAMQAGLPVVCTDIGGPVDIIKDPDFRCTPKDPDALAKAIKRRRDQMDGVGYIDYACILERYDPETVTSQMVALYKDVTNL